MGHRAVLLDIEGTTTSISFVYDTLFPYARREFAGFLAAHWADPDVQADVQLVRSQAAADAAAGVEGAPVVPDGTGADAREAVLAHLLWQMDSDRKTTGLKALQGRVWSDGYARGELKGHVYDEVPAALPRWTARGLGVYIYSSGSVAAQRLLFSQSVAGDLTVHLSGYFDTTTGPKKEASSYTEIVAALGLQPQTVVFVTDHIDEARAAHQAGLTAVLAVRPGNAPLPVHPFREVTTLDELDEVLV